ncbi:MAG: winged helix-turn-helix transcriptional regulator [Candidatus Muiribacteriota bacterium]
MFYKDEDLKFLKPAPNLRELMILNQLHKNPKTSQAFLSKILGISVSMVNKYISGFVEAGLINIKGKTNRDTTYNLTDKGAEIKRKRLISYMVETIKLYKDAKNEFLIKIESFRDSGVNKIAFYGAGETAEIAINAAFEAGLKIIAVVDQDDKKQGKTINGILVVPPSMLENMDFDGIIISSFGYTNEIYSNIKHYLKKDKKILKL